MPSPSVPRREFLRLGAGATAAGAIFPATILAPTMRSTAIAPVRFASIGTGTRGCDLLRAARLVPAGVCVGAADLYDSRHQAAQEVWGADIPTMRDYRALLDRKDVDAVLV